MVNETELALSTLKARRNILQNQVSLLKSEIAQIDLEIFSKEWIIISWDELTEYLKKYGHGTDYDRNPAVVSLNDTSLHYRTYCRLMNGERLEIGGYRNNDRFPEGKDLRVRYDFQPYR